MKKETALQLVRQALENILRYEDEIKDLRKRAETIKVDKNGYPVNLFDRALFDYIRDRQDACKALIKEMQGEARHYLEIYECGIAF